MPKVDKPIIGGDVTIETPPETIDPEMEVPEMLAPAPETDTIYNPPMQQGVQQANMLNEFLKQATGEKPLASLNIGDYVQCATARVSILSQKYYKMTGSGATHYKIFDVRDADFHRYAELEFYIEFSDFTDNIESVEFVVYESQRVAVETVNDFKNPAKFTFTNLYNKFNNIFANVITKDTNEYHIDINIYIYPSFKEEK